MSWRAIADDPNSEEALARRRAVLENATRDHDTNRARRIADLCRDRRVVDIGCVDHCFETSERSTWLHRQVADAASFCIGVDLAEDGVAAMTAAGYQAVVHDICKGLGPVADFAPFDVVVAGEVIEHLGNPQALFDFAHQALSPHGILVLTTPNPYAPHRVRAGQLGVTWENADHVFYAFPSGIAELAGRTGFVLEEYRTIAVRTFRRDLRVASGRLAQRLFTRATRRAARGACNQAATRDAQELYVNPFELFAVALTRSRRFLGGTAFYVLRKADGPV